MKWVVGILALVVLVFALTWLNAYKERFDVVRANVNAAVMELSLARDEVTADFARARAMPPPRDFPATSKNIRTIKLESDGRLVATLSLPDAATVDGKHIIYEPRVANGGVEWRCRSPDVDRKYLPVACR